MAAENQEDGGDGDSKADSDAHAKGVKRKGITAIIGGAIYALAWAARDALINFCSSRPEILYFVCIGLCALMLWGTHKLVSHIKNAPENASAPEQQKPMNEPTHNINISSTNQSGGFTGVNQGTVNLAPQPITLSESNTALLGGLLSKAPKFPLKVSQYQDPASAALAQQIVPLLSGRISSRSFDGVVSPPQEPGITIRFGDPKLANAASELVEIFQRSGLPSRQVRAGNEELSIFINGKGY